MQIVRALIDGLIFSILFGGLVTLMETINPRLQLHNYPPAIQMVVPPKTKEEQAKFKRMAIPSMLLLIAFLLGTVVQAYHGFHTGYLTLFLHCFVIFFVWNLFDLLVMDWLIFCTVTPKFLIIPGTGGNPAYKDYMFHVNGSFGKGLLIAIASAAAVAGVCFMILRI